jgi:ZIP family zinc transporter
MAIAMGALLDGIPESMVIGLGLLSGKSVPFVAIVAIFLSNLPEGLSSATGMKNDNRSRRYVFGVWGTIALVSGLASLAGFVLFENVSGEIVAATTAIAAGAILAMLADTMMPEAFETVHDFTGMITVAGFLAAFLLGKLGE